MLRAPQRSSISYLPTPQIPDRATHNTTDTRKDLRWGPMPGKEGGYGRWIPWPTPRDIDRARAGILAPCLILGKNFGLA